VHMFAGQSAGVLSNRLQIRISDTFSLLQGSIADEECTCMLTAAVAVDLVKIPPYMQ
jgi:hypothetical protein